MNSESNSTTMSNSNSVSNSTTAQVGMNSSMSTRRNNRRNNRKNNNSRRSMDGGKGKKRKASKWNLFTKKIFMEMKKKMGKKASFKMALKEASRRKKEM